MDVKFILISSDFFNVFEIFELFFILSILGWNWNFFHQNFKLNTTGIYSFKLVSIDFKNCHWRVIFYLSKTKMTIFCHYKPLSHSKLMPQSSNHDFRGKYPCARSGTLVPMRIKDIFTKNSCFLPYASVLEYE